VERLVGEAGEVAGLRAEFFHPGAREFDAKDSVAAVVADDRRDVETFARLSPERLQRIHRAAVGLNRDDWAVRAGNGRAGRAGEAEADGPAGLCQVTVTRRARGHRAVSAAARVALVHNDRAFRLGRG